MNKLKQILSSLDSDLDKDEFMFNLFDNLKKQVDEILLHGPCNKENIEQTATVYYHNNKAKTNTNFFKVGYRPEEASALPTVIANSMRHKDIKIPNELKNYEKDFLSGYLYGTGTCEVFSIIGACILAKEYDVFVSIETITSEGSHTYLKIQTEPEYIFDFWEGFLCRYNDTITWQEIFGRQYLRNNEATYKTDLQMESAQLINMASRFMTVQNKEKREEFLKLVHLKVQKELNPISLVESKSQQTTLGLLASQ